MPAAHPSPLDPSLPVDQPRSLAEMGDALRAELAFSRAVTDSLAEGVYALDRAGRVAFANPAAQGLLGWREDELRGGDMHARIHARCPDGTPNPAETCPLLGVMRSRVAVRRDEDVFTRRDGTLFPVSYTAAPLFDDQDGAGAGDIVGAVVVFRDRTAQVRLEEERAALLARAEAAVRLRNDFLTVAAHDLRSPLTNMLGRVQLAQTRIKRGGAVDPTWLTTQLASLAGSTQRLLATVDELNDMTRVELGQALDLVVEDVDLGALVHAVADEVAAGVGAQSLGPAAITVAAPGAPLVVAGDRNRLARMLQNVIGNAVKYSTTGTPVRVDVRGEGGTGAVVTVRDDGVGIPADELPRVFERFYRASTARGIKGSGIGLSGSKPLVEQHGGTITVASAEGQGTTVTVRLPRARAGQRVAAGAPAEGSA
jgi:PAS domain S-box-containing protein